MHLRRLSHAQATTTIGGIRRARAADALAVVAAGCSSSGEVDPDRRFRSAALSNLADRSGLSWTAGDGIGAGGQESRVCLMLRHRGSGAQSSRRAGMTG